MPAPKSQDICELIVAKYIEEGLPQETIARHVGCCLKTVSQTLKRFREGQQLVLKGRTGCKHSNRQFNEETLAELKQLLFEDDALYLDELRDLLELRTGLCTSISGVQRALEELNITRKQLTTRARESDPYRRAVYASRMFNCYQLPHFIFIDESSADQRPCDRLWSTYYIRVDAICAADMINFAKDNLVPVMRPFANAQSVLVLDNCRIHHDEEFQQILKQHGMRVEFWPPYSPQLNPIELAWGKMKSILRRWSSNLAEVGMTQKQALAWALQQVTPEDCRSYILSCGSLYDGHSTCLYSE
ncbi:hypothetical protein WJX73_006060 [Symbiochloris irregularis]|uniref:Tc1-like transposase DDE domain-containing protein n=1 Tax=Symbiochloris irregularis TaxID=706552 RepID=A0AAW1PS14_9CHLO